MGHFERKIYEGFKYWNHRRQQRHQKQRVYLGAFVVVCEFHIWENFWDTSKEKSMKDSNIEFTDDGTNNNRFILTEKKEPINWLIFLWQDKPVVVGAIAAVFEFNIWILHRFFFRSVPKLFSKLDFADNFTVFNVYLKEFLGLGKIYEGFNYWIHRQQQYHQQQQVYLVREKGVVYGLLFLWQDWPIVFGAVVVVCEFNIWILHRFFVGSVQINGTELSDLCLKDWYRSKTAMEYSTSFMS